MSCNFGTLDGLCDKCLNHMASVMPIYWLMFANVVFCIWKMLLPCFLLQMLLPLLCIFIGRYYCHILLADVIAMICILPKFVSDVIATVAVAVANCGNDVLYYCRCYGHF